MYEPCIVIDEYKNGNHKNEQEHIIPRRTIKSMTRQDVLTLKNNFLFSLFFISYACN